MTDTPKTNADQQNVTKDELKAIMNMSIGSKSLVLAYVLWFFLGAFGIHRFYLGKTVSGIIMLMLTLVGVATSMLGIGLIFLFIVAVWWMLDALLIFLASKKANDKVNKAIDAL